MVELGYSLSSEEHGPNDLVRYAQRAEQAGFTFALISDHFHPWTRRQGQSPFAWSVLGAIAATTKRLRLGTGVTCPTFRYHPAIIAQAAATLGAMIPGRFFLGLGSGENLNEHIVGEGWPPADVRQDMLEEAVDLIHHLWSGGIRSYYGEYFVVENAQIFTLPDPPPPIYIAAGGTESAELAGQLGDGLISTSPNKEVLKTFDDEGGKGKPRIGQLTVCWAADEKQAYKTAFEWWPNAALKGELSQELPLPQNFEEACELATEEQVAKEIVCGPDPNKHLDKIQKFVDAGFDQVYIHQVGPDQEGFFKFYQQQILPRFQSQPAAAGVGR